MRGPIGYDGPSVANPLRSPGPPTTDSGPMPGKRASHPRTANLSRISTGLVVDQSLVMSDREIRWLTM